jgi:hypothetical protein
LPNIAVSRPIHGETFAAGDMYAEASLLELAAKSSMSRPSAPGALPPDTHRSKQAQRKPCPHD